MLLYLQNVNRVRITSNQKQFIEFSFEDFKRPFVPGAFFNPNHSVRSFRYPCADNLALGFGDQLFVGS